MRDYCQSRGLTAAHIEHAKIGFIPRNFHKSPLAKQHQEILLEAGVIAEGERGLYTPLGGRLTLPITDERNRVIALAGRVISDDAKGPKYRNTSESAAFKKSKVLYGLAHAVANKPDPGKLDRIYVVEGYFDVITAQLNGFPNTVATMGTAVTNEHLKLLARHAEGVTFVFDPDKAGNDASRRALLASLSFVNDLDIRFAFMPQEGDKKMDPDAFIRARGADAFQDILNQAQDIPTFAARYVVGEQPGNNLAALLRSGIEDRGREVYRAIPPGLSRELLAQHIAAEVSHPLKVRLDPEHLGMRINTELAMAELHDLAYGRINAEDSPTPFSDVLNGNDPQEDHRQSVAMASEAEPDVPEVDETSLPENNPPLHSLHLQPILLNRPLPPRKNTQRSPLHLPTTTPRQRLQQSPFHPFSSN